MIKNGSKSPIWVTETLNFGHLFSFWSPIKTLDFGQFHLDSPAGDSQYIFLIILVWQVPFPEDPKIEKNYH